MSFVQSSKESDQALYYNLQFLEKGKDFDDHQRLRQSDAESDSTNFTFTYRMAHSFPTGTVLVSICIHIIDHYRHPTGCQQKINKLVFVN